MTAIPQGSEIQQQAKFWLWESTLLAAPVIALFSSIRTNRFPIRRHWYFIALACIAFGLIFNLTAWSLRGFLADTIIGLIGYLAAVWLVFALLNVVASRVWRVLLRVVAAIPILLGLTLGTIGILGLMFILADSTPRVTQDLTKRYAFYMRYSGGAYTSEDFLDIDLVYRTPFLPVERSVWHKTYSDRQFNWTTIGPVVVLSSSHDAIITVVKRTGDTDIVKVRLP